METELITKRLHISGLTPSITTTDLSHRLSKFGTVKDLDGFGKLDALGQPRKFGYATLEGSRAQLAKCVNVLSGSTWKGTKLRIGDPKPDYKERMMKESAAVPEPPKNKRKRAAGVHAPDMSLVTASNVSDRKGWKVTTMGRMVRPVRMRPERPLPPQAQSTVRRDTKAKAARKDGKEKDGKGKRKRIREPNVRARRRTIDPTRWDSVHLKGLFLDVVTADRVKVDQKEVEPNAGAVDTDSSGSGNDDDSHENNGNESDTAEASASIPNPTKQIMACPAPSPSPSAPVSPPQPISSLSGTTATHNSSLDTDLTQEKLTSLSLLKSLFGTQNDDDWIGRESVGSDIDDAELERLKREGGRGNIGAGIDGVADVEEVPMDLDRAQQTVDTGHQGKDEDEEMEVVGVQELVEQEPVIEQQLKAPVQVTKLKDLFAPREEDAGFSLLDHLDLDLELDDEIDIPNFTQALPAPADDEPASIPTTQQISLTTHSSRTTQFTYDPTLPLFFPLPSSLQSDSQIPKPAGRQKDLLIIARERGWDPASAAFYRIETEDEIRKRWEESKVELTREWKRRFREAGKVRRRRGGGDGD